MGKPHDVVDRVRIHFGSIQCERHVDLTCVCHIAAMNFSNY